MPVVDCDHLSRESHLIFEGSVFSEFVGITLANHILEFLQVSGLGVLLIGRTGR